MINNLKEVVKEAVAAGASVVNDTKVVNVSIYPAQTENVDYWATITLAAAVPGMVSEGTGDAVTYKKGRTRTITCPLGTLMTCLIDSLVDSDAEEAFDLIGYKAIIQADAEREALSPEGHPYISYLHKLYVGAKISVLSRDVTKGKVKSLFSLNEREVTVERDSVWHDVYGLNGVRPSIIAKALSYCESTNESNAVSETEVKANAFDELMSKYKSNNVNAALA